jgi:hypothetical protein
MAVSMTITFPVNAHAATAQDDICANTGYVSPEVNGMTKKQWVELYFKDLLADHHARRVAKDARDAAYATALAALNITVVVG